MKIAIFSDVHSNLPALEAVLTDIKRQRASIQVYLGDIVGYNAEPARCVERVRETCDDVIQGNHDEACAVDLDIADFSSIAQAGIKYSRAHLSAEHKQYLRDLPLLKTTDRWTYVHASLAEPGEWHYVDSPREALLHFREQRTPVAFCGHTHRPLVWLRDKSGELAIEKPRAIVTLDRPAKYLVNVGSVGQNRDHDPRACYTIFDTDNNVIQFRRISYDVRATQKKILAAGLPKLLAWRLELGL
jgi:diadenosine tetraphosphatase ApaH/serine/threonine PP2A family protein phosphatase